MKSKRNTREHAHANEGRRIMIVLGVHVHVCNDLSAVTSVGACQIDRLVHGGTWGGVTLHRDALLGGNMCLVVIAVTDRRSRVARRQRSRQIVRGGCGGWRGFVGRLP